jgi:hypothetical protein
MCFSTSAELNYLEPRYSISTLKNLSCRSIHFQSAEYSQENNVLHAAASSIDSFLGEINLFLQLS